MPRIRLGPARFGAILFLTTLFLPSALGQEPPEPDVPKTTLREQTIYIPYKKLRETFEKEGRGVFLPYEKFRELWQAARDKPTGGDAAGPPVGFVIAEIDNQATASGDVVRVEAVLKIDLVAEGWHAIPLRLDDAAILSAEHNGEPARLVSRDGGYALLIEKKGKEAEQIEIVLEYAKSFTKSPGQNRVSFQAPLAAINRWRIRIPEAGAKINVSPMLAATEVPSAESGERRAESGEPEEGAPPEPAEVESGDAAADETVMLAFVGATPTVTIGWTPKSEGAAGLDALATAEAETSATIDEGVLRTTTRLTYKISRAELSQLVIDVPADQKIAGVHDPNVRQWQVAETDDGQRITIELFEPTGNQQPVQIELEKFIEDAAEQEVAVPVVRAVGVGRQQGHVVVRLAPSLRAEVVRRTGLVQTDAADLPAGLNSAALRSAALKSAAPDFAFAYSALPFDLALRVTKVEPRITVEELVEAYLEPERLTVTLFAIYQIERAGVFELALTVPSGYQVRQVRGHKAAGAEAAGVDAHHVLGEDGTSLRVNLSRKALGRVGLVVEIQKQLDDPNLLSPTGEAAQVEVSLPHVATDRVERATGRLVVYAPESLRVNPGEIEGLRSISFEEAFADVESTRGGRFASLRPVLAYAYSEAAETIPLSAERRKPHVTARQLLVASIEPGVVKYEATFYYDILYSGVKSLRIDIPAAVASLVRNNTSGISEQVIDPPPDDLDEGDVAWRLTGETELIGSRTIRLTWEETIDKLDVGKSAQIEVPVHKPRDIDRAWGQVVLVKEESIDVRPTGDPEGLRPIDPGHDLMPGASVPDAARAFEFHNDWSLTISATRYELEAVKHTSIERGLVRMVLTRSDQIAVQALYRMRSARQRLPIALPADAAFDTEPLRINGRAVTLERGDKGLFYAPLVGLAADSPFLLELRFTMPGDAARLDHPTFPDNPAAQKIYLAAYLPEERALLGSRGPWTEEMRWHNFGLLDYRPVPLRGDGELIAWVSEGTPSGGDPGGTFSTDGKLVLFSTLRPQAPPDGSLHLSTMNEKWLSGLVLAALVIAGLVLLRQPMTARLMALAALAALLILSGVFLTTFSAQILDSAMLAAVALVLLLWFAVYLTVDRPRRKTAKQAEEETSVQPEPPASDEGQPPPPPEGEEPKGGEGHA